MKNKKKISFPIVIAAILLLVALICLACIYKSGTYQKIADKFGLAESEEDVIQISEQPVTTPKPEHSDKEIKKEQGMTMPEEDKEREIIEKQEPLLDEKIDIADIYCVMGENAVFYVYNPQCGEYEWEYFNKKTAGWDNIESLDDVVAGYEIDEYNRSVATLTVPAKKDYDALEVRCVTDQDQPQEVNETATGRLYVIEPFEADALTIPEQYETTACKLLYTNEIPVSVTYKDGTAREFKGLQGLYFSYEVSSKEDIQKNQNEVTQTITKVSAEERSYMPLMGENPIGIRYRRNESTTVKDYQINILGIDDQAPVISSYDIDEYQISKEDLKEGIEVAVRITAEDNCTSASKLVYCFCLETEKTPAKDLFSADCRQTIKTNKNGMYGIYVMDEAGNIAKETVELVVVDSKAPTINAIQLEYPDMGRWYDSNIIHVDADDKSTLTYNYSCNGVDSGYILDNFYTVTANGTWTVKVKDAAGNITSEDIAISNIDHKAPTILGISTSTENNVLIGNRSDGVNGTGSNGKNGANGIGTDGSGENGLDGSDGRTGLGRDGRDGRDGIDGQDGKTGAAGPAGATGKTGATGKAGTAGKDGSDGKDGVDGNSLFIRYATDASGANMATAPTSATKYMGTYTGQEASSNPADYTWTRYSDATITYGDGTLFITQ